MAREPHLSCESSDSLAANASHTIWPKPPSEIAGRPSSRHWNCGFASKIATWLFARTNPPSEVCCRKHNPPSSTATICRFLMTVLRASRILASQKPTTFEFDAESSDGAKYRMCRMTQDASRRVVLGQVASTQVEPQSVSRGTRSAKSRKNILTTTGSEEGAFWRAELNE